MASVTTKRLTVTNIRQALQQLLDTYQREKAEIQQGNNTCFTGHWDSACQTIYDVAAALNISFEKQPGKPCLSTQRRHQPASRTPDNANGQLSGGHFLYHQTHWHAKDYYQPTLTKHAGLVEESRLFLLAYAQTKDREAACDALLKSIRQEHSEALCKAILRVICHRFVRWNPPDWVLDDLVTFARGDETDAFKAALLLHTARQDALLYDFIQVVVFSAWQSGTRVLTQESVHRFLADTQQYRTEILRWNQATHQTLADQMLATLQDYGVLTGTVISKPRVPSPVVVHLVRLLQAEGIPQAQLARHTDWWLWLWDEPSRLKAIDHVRQTHASEVR